MHVVIISADFRPNPGGIASHAWDLAEGLVRLEQKVTVIGGHLSAHAHRLAQMPKPSFVLHLRQNGAGVHGGPRGVSLARSVLEHASWIAWARGCMRAACAEATPDVVHWHTPFYDPFVAEVASRSAARVFTNHRSDVFEMLESPLWRALLRRLDGGADLVMAPSPERTERSARLGIPASRCHFVPNGIDPARFVATERSVALAAELGIGAADEVVVVVARPVPVKGLRYALEALPAVVRERPRCKLLLVGGDSSPHQRELERMARSLGVTEHVVWAGERPNTQMPLLYALANVALVPSLSEGMSVAALEAMAAGLPLVATRVGSNEETVDRGRAGLLVPTADATEISRAIVRLLRDAPLRSSLGRAGRERVLQRYTLDAMCQAVLGHYHEAIARAHSR